MVNGRRVVTEFSEAEFIKNIQRIFEESGLTQNDLAKTMGINQANVSRLLRGQVAWKPKHIARFSKVTGVPVRKLIGRDLTIKVSGFINKDGFVYDDLSKEGVDVFGCTVVPPDIDDLDNLYVVQFLDKCDWIKKGSLLYVKRHD